MHSNGFIFFLCTRLREGYGQRARGGSSEIKNKRSLDIPSFAITRRLLAAARTWLLLRAALAWRESEIDTDYVELLRNQFVRMFIDFVKDTTGVNNKEHDSSRFPRCPSAHWKNISVDTFSAAAIIFPGGPNFREYGGPLESPIAARVPRMVPRNSD